ncbi:MAG: hypothetical protein V4539_07895 [Bacteroidota bacterium]
MQEMINTIPSDKDQLDILAHAISDMGHWSWWASSFPGVFQVEFGGTLLYFPPASEGNRPQTKIAIRFSDPVSVSFLNRGEETDFDWVDLLHEDKIDSPSCSSEEFVFGNPEYAMPLLNQASSHKTVHGYEPLAGDFFSEPFCLVFWCGDNGLAVASKDLMLLNHSGVIPVSNVQELNREWWRYWREYWDKAGTAEALPKDFYCEVTIPIKG